MPECCQGANWSNCLRYFSDHLVREYEQDSWKFKTYNFVLPGYLMVVVENWLVRFERYLNFFKREDDYRILETVWCILLKKSTLDLEDHNNYQPVSDVLFFSNVNGLLQVMTGLLQILAVLALIASKDLQTDFSQTYFNLQSDSAW